jgi:hypothetical protein
MDKRWISENCGNCVFNIDAKCRRGPPNIDFRVTTQILHLSIYPRVNQNTPACYLWRDKENAS